MVQDQYGFIVSVGINRELAAVIVIGLVIDNQFRDLIAIKVHKSILDYFSVYVKIRVDDVFINPSRSQRIVTACRDLRIFLGRGGLGGLCFLNLRLGYLRLRLGRSLPGLLRSFGFLRGLGLLRFRCLRGLRLFRLLIFGLCRGLVPARFCFCRSCLGRRL